MYVSLDTIQLAEQDRLGVHRVTGVDEIFSRADRQVIHHFQATWDDARRNDVAHRSAGLFHRIECRQQHLGHLRLGQQLDRDLGDDAEHAFGTGEQRQQVETGRIQRVGAQHHALALDGEDLDFQQVVHGQAVFQAMHAAGVLSHVAADGAGDL